MSIYLISVYLSSYLSIYRSIDLSIDRSIDRSIYLPVYLQASKPSYSARLLHFSKLTTSKTQQFCMTSSFVKVDNIKNEAILRDFFIIWTGQHPKRNNSARLLQFLNVTTSKTKRFCEASFKNGKLSAELTASYQCVLRFFQSTCRKYCAYHEKVMPGHTKCCTCHAKSSQQTWRSDAPKCNPSQEISALTSWHLWWPCPLYCACHAKCIFEDPLQIPRLPSLLEMLQNPHVLQTFDKVHNPLRLPRESTSELPKVLRTRFCTFDLEMCFAPQQRALFRHLNFQKWSENGVFCTFWLRNVLRATTACTFSTSQLPKVVREWCVLYILTSKCASRHNGVHFFDIATSKSGPTLVCFVHFDFEMCFAPQRRAIFHFSSGQLAPHPPL